MLYVGVHGFRYTRMCEVAQEGRINHYWTMDPLAILKEQVRQTNQTTVAKRLRVTPSYLNDVLNKRRQVGPKLLRAMGIKKVVLYEQT